VSEVRIYNEWPDYPQYCEPYGIIDHTAYMNICNSGTGECVWVEGSEYAYEYVPLGATVNYEYICCWIDLDPDGDCASTTWTCDLGGVDFECYCADPVTLSITADSCLEEVTGCH
jgi:hypothetical protein